MVYLGNFSNLTERGRYELHSLLTRGSVLSSGCNGVGVFLQAAVVKRHVSVAS